MESSSSIFQNLTKELKTIDFKHRKTLEDLIEIIGNSAKGTAELYKSAEGYAEEIGEAISSVLVDWVKSGAISGDELTALRIAQQAVPPTLKAGYDYICGESIRIQKILNERAGLGLAPRTAPFNEDAASDLAKKAVDVAQAEGAERATWVVEEPVKTFARQVLDRNIEENVDFQSRAGLTPTVERIVVANCCKWCRAVAGRYEYHTEPEGFWKRHGRCRCLIIYDPADGRDIEIK